MSTVEQFLQKYSVQPGPADLVRLTSIAAAFGRLPYENVTKILKEARSINEEQKLRYAEEVLSDHLRFNTGGTCFSLCNALHRVLTESRFQAHIAMGDMHYGANIHCAVIAKAGAHSYLLDPGYLLHQPIPLPAAGLEVLHKTSMNTITLRHEQEFAFSLYTLEGAEFKWRYRLRNTPTSVDEFRRHWIHSFSLNSMDNIMLSKVTQQGRLYYRKDRLEQVSQTKRIKEKLPQLDAGLLSSVFQMPPDLILRAHHALLSR